METSRETQPGHGELLDAHWRRLEDIDPAHVRLATAPGRDLAPDDAAAPPPGRRFEASHSGARALLLASSERVDAGDEGAIWGGLHRESGALYSAGPEEDRSAAAALVLDAWIADVSAGCRPGDEEDVLRLDVASRDVGLVPLLLRRGFAPVGIVGLRQRRGPVPVAPRFPVALVSGVTMRHATAADVPAMGAMDVRLLELDSHFGGVRLRAGAQAHLTRGLAGRVEAFPGLSWMIETEGGEPLGYLHFVESEPGHAYLAALYIEPTGRGAGLGEAVMRLAHDWLDARGYALETLSYAVANPRSGPFWCRSGYRPVVTQWQRCPAVV